jgi:hypothetical protein
MERAPHRATLKFTLIPVSSLQTGMNRRFLKGSPHTAPFAWITKHRIMRVAHVVKGHGWFAIL